MTKPGTPLLVAITVVGAVLRFGFLDQHSYWYDEAITVDLVRMDLWGMFEGIWRGESTPPLYYLLAWAWAKLFGTGEVGLRSLSALFGTAAIPVAYAFAATILSRRVAVAVALLAAVNPMLIWYSQEARGYSLLVLLSCLSLVLFARLLREVERRTLVLWALVCALALATHYFAVFLVVPQAVWLVVRSRAPAVLAAVGAVGAAGVALLPLAVHQRSLDPATFLESASLPVRFVRTFKEHVIGLEAPLEVLLSVVAAAICVAGALLALPLLRREPGLRIPVVLGLAVALGPLVLAGLGIDYVEARNMLPLWLPLLTVIAAGLVLGAGRLGAAGVGVLAALGLSAAVGVAVEPLWRRPDWRGLAKALGRAQVPRAIVFKPAYSDEPLVLYRPDTSPMEAAAPVREVALVAVAGREIEQVHPTTPPRPEHARVPGFRELRRRYADTYSVVVLRAPRPRRVTPAQLQRYWLSEDPGAVGVAIQRASVTDSARSAP